MDQRCDTATYACKRYETLKKGTFLLLTSGQLKAPAYCVVGAIKMQSSYVAVCYHRYVLYALLFIFVMSLLVILNRKQVLKNTR